MSTTKALNPRTARTPADGEQQYVIAQGAPQHYVDGYGLCNAGAIVTLAPGVTPGRWYVEVSPEDAQKAQASEADSQRLAVLAAAKIKAKGNSEDVNRKQAADQARQAQAAADAQAKAQDEADAIAKLAASDAKAQAAADQATAEKQRADELQAQLEASRRELAAAQSQLEKVNAAATEADKAKGDAKTGDKPK